MSDYETQIERRQVEIEANEGHAPPKVDELWDRAAYEARGAASWIDDMPVSETEIQTAKDDLVMALAHLELAEERLADTDRDAEGSS